MANEGLAVPSRFGTDSTALDIFLKVFGGEVLLSYAERNLMDGLTRTRTISSGKSAQFPIVGTANAVYHTPGENIIQEGAGTPEYLQSPATGEKVIHIDELLVCPILVSDIDEAMSHFDVREPYARAMGEALAKKYDQSLFQVVANGATQAAVSGWAGGGQQVTDASFTSSYESALDTLETIAAGFDANDVPMEGRHAVLDPATYRMLVSSAGIDVGGSSVSNQRKVTLGSTDTPGTGANVGRGTVAMFQGFQLHWSNRLADLRQLGLGYTAGGGSGTITTAAPGTAGQRGTDYEGDFSDLVGLAFQTDSVGTVKLMDLSMQAEYKIEYQGTLLVGRYAVGHGVLRQDACARIDLVTPGF